MTGDAGPRYRGAASPGLFTGVDTPQAPHLLAVQLDLPDHDLAAACRRVETVCAALQDLGVSPGFADPGPVPPATTYLVGASVKFVKGDWSPWRDDEDHSPRWGRRVRCPRSLQTMNAKRDGEFSAFRSGADRTAHETDLVILLEGTDPAALAAIAARLEVVAGTTLRRHTGALRTENRDPFGFHDGVSNLQSLRTDDPAKYLSYLMHTEDWLTDGTYLVLRKYRLHVDRLAGTAPVAIPDSDGDPTRTMLPEQVIGRCRPCGAVVHGDSGIHLPAAPDEVQGAAAHPQSHLRKANPRGYGHTNFGHDVQVPDARILRRGYPYRDNSAGEVEEGLLFLAFQADIQETGFEFIHNEWMMSDFNGAPDPLLAPEAGLVEPLTGCYYFVPRDQRAVAQRLFALIETPPDDDW